MKKRILLFLIISGSLFQSCGFYTFTGADTGQASTFQVNYFQNVAPIVEPGIGRAFTLELQDLIQTQTNLNQTNSGGDIIYEGEIVDYFISPISSTANNRAAQNRLTIVVNVRFYSTMEPDKDFERRFSFYDDYPAAAPLIGTQLDASLEEIFTRIAQDIFNESLANW